MGKAKPGGGDGRGSGGAGAERLFATPSFIALARFMMTTPFDVKEIRAEWCGNGDGGAKDFLATLSLAASTTFLRRWRSRRIWSCNAEAELCGMRAGMLMVAEERQEGSIGAMSCRAAALATS